MIGVAALQQRAHKLLKQLGKKKQDDKLKYPGWTFEEKAWHNERRSDLVVRWSGQSQPLRLAFAWPYTSEKRPENEPPKFVKEARARLAACPGSLVVVPARDPSDKVVDALVAENDAQVPVVYLHRLESWLDKKYKADTEKPSGPTTP